MKLEDVDHAGRRTGNACSARGGRSNFDQLVWGTIAPVAPTSTIKRQQNPGQVATPGAAGDAGVSTPGQDELDRLRQVGAAHRLAQPGGAPVRQKQATTLAPSQIESSVKLSGSVMTGPRPSAGAHVELAGTGDVDSVERDLLSAMGAHAEAAGARVRKQRAV